jgi:hypothetical protein
MKAFFSVILIVLAANLVPSVGHARQPSVSQPAPGISTSAGDEQDEAEIQDNLARLKPADRELAESQKFCPVLKRRLGEMGTPIKIVIKGQPVFVCCKGCARKAQANPEKTLAIVVALLRANRER